MRIIVAFLLVVSATACVPNAGPVPGQTQTHTLTADSCVTLPRTIDSVTVLAIAKLQAADSTKPLPLGFELLIIETLRKHLVLPKNLDLHVMHSFNSVYTTAIPYIGAHAFFTLRQSKGPSDIAFGTATMHEGYRQALLNAIFSLHGDSLPPFPAGVKTLDLELHIYSLPMFGMREDALFHTTLPIYPVDEPPRLLREESRKSRPKYPRDGLMAGKGDTITIDFVVDASGRPVESPMDPVSGTYRSFAQSALKALPGMYFSPLKIGGCRAASYLRLPFTYTMER